MPSDNEEREEVFIGRGSEGETSLVNGQGKGTTNAGPSLAESSDRLAHPR